MGSRVKPHDVFIIITLMIVSCQVCTAADSPAFLVYLQGNQSIVTEETNGTYSLKVTGLLPYASISGDNLIQTNMWDINSILPFIKNHAQSGIVLSGNAQRLISLVSLDNMTYTPDSQTITADLTSLPYYEGTLLNISSDNLARITPGIYNTSGIFIEVIGDVPKNIFGPLIK